MRLKSMPDRFERLESSIEIAKRRFFRGFCRFPILESMFPIHLSSIPLRHFGTGNRLRTVGFYERGQLIDEERIA